MAKTSEDAKYHFKIWNGPNEVFDEDSPLHYVENYNDPRDFGELAGDYALAAQSVFDQYSKNQLTNYIAPLLHLIRQCLELDLKWLCSQVAHTEHQKHFEPEHTHNLKALWDESMPWIMQNIPLIARDVRLDATFRLVQAFHSIDPNGDLFRFGLSKVEAFSARKSADRVGFKKSLFPDFENAHYFCQHWALVVAWGYRGGGNEEEWQCSTPGGWNPLSFPRI
ncbi:MAG: hypothetical protein RIA08_01565 [Roseovarius sp.]|uniref:hypothetical protein n=1 Tax=Roseovarius sp. TaxID=1486281 RepID=UPI0032EBF8ED